MNKEFIGELCLIQIETITKLSCDTQWQDHFTHLGIGQRGAIVPLYPMTPFPLPIKRPCQEVEKHFTANKQVQLYTNNTSSTSLPPPLYPSPFLALLHHSARPLAVWGLPC